MLDTHANTGFSGGLLDNTLMCYDNTFFVCQVTVV